MVVNISAPVHYLNDDNEISALFYKSLNVPGSNTVAEETNEFIKKRIDEIINTLLRRLVTDGNAVDSYGDFHSAGLYLYPLIRKGVKNIELPLKLENRIKKRYKGVPMANRDVVGKQWESDKVT